MSRYLVVYLLLLMTASYIHQESDYFIPDVQPLKFIATQHGDWTMLNQNVFSEKVLAILKPSDYVSRTYIDNKGNHVELYLGYHSGEPGSGRIHSPKNCLPGSGWHRKREEIRTISHNGKLFPLVSAIYQKGEEKELFLYWFQIGGKRLTNEFELKITEIKNSILYNRTDSAFIRINVHIKDDYVEAVSLGEQFVKDFYNEFDAVLPK